MRSTFNLIGCIYFLICTPFLSYSQESQSPETLDPNAELIDSSSGAAKQNLQPKNSSTDEVIPSQNGCMKDIDCKGDRICVNGVCVSPAQQKPNEEKQGFSAQQKSSSDSIKAYPISKVSIIEQHSRENIFISKYNTTTSAYEKISTLPCTLSLNRLDYYRIFVDSTWGSYPFKLPAKENINLLVNAGSKKYRAGGFAIVLGGTGIALTSLIIGLCVNQPESNDVPDGNGYLRREYKSGMSSQTRRAWLLGGGVGGLAISIPGYVLLGKIFTKIRDIDSNKRLDL